MNRQPEHPTDRARRCAPVFGIVALTLFVLVCVPHFWKLGDLPRGFFGDEASNAYNAYSIALTGADEYGVRHPVFFRCLDDYHDPVMIYFMAPLVKTWGLTQRVARFPSAFFMMLASVAFGFLVHAYVRNKWLSLAGAALFSISPWAFPVSRTISGGYTAMLFGMTLGWVWSLAALRKKSYVYAVLAAVGWAFAMYAHNVGRPVTAVWLVGFALALNRLLIKRWRVWLTFALSFVFCLVPMIIAVLHEPGSMTSRFNAIGIVQQNATFGGIFRQVALRYVDYFSPQFLFFKGDTNLRHHTRIGGELFLFTVPLILAGAYRVVRSFKRIPYHRLLAMALVLYPVAAVFTIDRMHAGRTIDGIIPWLLLTIIGVGALWRCGRLGRTGIVVICVAGLIEGTSYLTDYFRMYQTRSSAAYQTGFNEALQYCFSHIASNQTLYVSGSVGTACDAYIDTNFKPFAYIFLLFHGRIDPWSYQHEGLSTTVIRPYLERIDEPGLLLRCNNTPNGENNQFLIIPNYESVPPDAALLVTFQDEDLEYQVWDVRQKWERETDAAPPPTPAP